MGKKIPLREQLDLANIEIAGLHTYGDQQDKKLLESEGEIQELRDELTKTRQRAEEVQAERDGFEKQIAGIQAELVQAEELAVDLQTEREGFEDQVGKLEYNLESALAELKRVRRDLIAAASSILTALVEEDLS